MRPLARCGLAVVCLAMAAADIACAQEYSSDLQRNAQSKRIIQAFKAWAKRNAIANTSIAVMRKDILLGSFGKGTHTPTTPVPIASNSKAITAVCIAKLVDDKTITFNSKLGKVLAAYFQTHRPKDRRAKSITIGQLVNHSSGIQFDEGATGLPLDQENLEQQVANTLAVGLATDPGLNHFYTNMNYAVLGYVIQVLTGQTYETYCNNRILVPVGVTDAFINPSLRVMSAWGGWVISAVDYTKFTSYYLPSSHLIKKKPAAWPQFPLGNGVSYGLGTFMAPDGTGHDFWHVGSATYVGTVNASFGADFSVIAQQVRYSVNYEPTLTEEQLADLDASLTAAR